MKNHKQLGRTHRRRGIALAALVAASGLVATGATTANQQPGPGIDEAREALGEWTEIRRVISKERRDWQLGREVLGDRIELVDEQIGSLREKLEEAKSKIAETDTQTVEKVAQRDRLVEAAKGLEDTIEGLERRTLVLLARLPAPVVEKVELLSQRIPKDPSETKLSLGQRFESVVGVLNEVNRFHSEISATSEVRELGNGTSAEVTTLYVGIGKAFYHGANGTVAGVGDGSGETWAWTEANGSAAAIRETVGIFKGEELPGFVKLPVTIED